MNFVIKKNFIYFNENLKKIKIWDFVFSGKNYQDVRIDLSLDAVKQSFKNQV